MEADNEQQFVSRYPPQVWESIRGPRLLLQLHWEEIKKRKQRTGVNVAAYLAK